MLQQTDIEILGHMFTLGDLLKIAGFLIVFIGAFIKIFLFVKDWERVGFKEESFSYNPGGGVISIKGLSLLITYSGKGSILIDKICTAPHFSS